MLRVLMVLEDYGELVFLQTVLKKLGFDVDAIQKPRAFADNLLKMNPDLVVMTAHGKRVKGVELVSQIRRTRGLPRVILLRSPGAPQEAQADIDGWLETPVAALALLNLIADLAGLNKQVLSDKFQKLRMQETAREQGRVLKEVEESDVTLEPSTGETGNFGQLASSTLSSDERSERYQKFLNEEPPEETGFGNKQVAEHVRALRAQENKVDRSELERERKAFVEHLFKRKP